MSMGSNISNRPIDRNEVDPETHCADVHGDYN